MARVENFLNPEYREIIKYDGGSTTDVEAGLFPNGNPIIFGYYSEDFAVNSSYSSVRIFPNNYTTSPSALGDMVDGDTLTIFDVKFTARDNPTQVNEIFTFDSGSTVDEVELFIDSIVFAINSNSKLSTYFTAKKVDSNNSNYKVLLVISKIKGSEYNLNISNTSTTGDVYAFFGAIGQDEYRAQKLQKYNYGVYLQLWQPRNNVYYTNYYDVDSEDNDKLLITLNQKYNGENEFYFDISSYTKDNLINLPTTGYGGFYFEENAIKPYYIRYGEEFSGGLNLSTTLPDDDDNKLTRQYEIGKTDLFWVYPAWFETGIRENNFYEYFQMLFKNGFTNTNQQIKPLTYAPEYKQVRLKTEDEFLYFIFINDFETTKNRRLRLVVDFVFMDGTEVNDIVIYQNELLNNSGLYYCNVSHDILTINSLDSGNISYSGKSGRVLEYTCKIEYDKNDDNWTEITRKTYEINRQYPQVNHKLYWVNDFSVLDSFDFEGYIRKTIDVDEIEYKKSYDYSLYYQRDRHLNAIAKKPKTTEVTYFTNLINEEHYEYVKNIITSNKIYRRRNYDIINEQSESITEIDGFESLNLVDYNYEYNERTKQYRLQVTVVPAFNENVINE